jgi:hypothetical protein
LPSSVNCRRSLRSAIRSKRALEVIGVKATLGSGPFGHEALEHIPRELDDALVFADADAELDSLQLGIPTGILGKLKNMCAAPGCGEL